MTRQKTVETIPPAQAAQMITSNDAGNDTISPASPAVATTRPGAERNAIDQAVEQCPEIKDHVKRMISDLGLPATNALLGALIDQCRKARSEEFGIELQNWPDDEKEAKIAALQTLLMGLMVELAEDAWSERDNGCNQVSRAKLSQLTDDAASVAIKRQAGAGNKQHNQ